MKKCWPWAHKPIRINKIRNVIVMRCAICGDISFRTEKLL